MSVRTIVATVLVAGLLHVAAATARGTGSAGGGSVPPKATPAMQREIRELASLLESDDLDVRRATAERIIGMGEAALVPFEEEMRRQRLAPNGQVKLVLLKLRSLREDRLWDAALAELGRKPRELSFTMRDASGPVGTVKLKTRPAAEPAQCIELEVEITPQRRGSAAAAPTRLQATLSQDRTLTPRRVELLVDRSPVGDLVISDHRLRGRLRDREIDAPAPPPLALDWALPLVVDVMPDLPENELVFTLVRAEQGATEGLLVLRQVGGQPMRGEPKASKAIRFELSGAAVGGPPGFGTRRFEVDDKGRLVLAELGDGVVLEAGGRSGAATR